MRDYHFRYLLGNAGIVLNVAITISFLLTVAFIQIALTNAIERVPKTNLAHIYRICYLIGTYLFMIVMSYWSLVIGLFMFAYFQLTFDRAMRP